MMNSLKHSLTDLKLKVHTNTVKLTVLTTDYTRNYIGKSSETNCPIPPTGRGGGTKLESKESIVEIKDLRFQVAQAESRLNLQTGEIAELRSKLARAEEENLSLQNAITSQNTLSNVAPPNTIERDSLDLTALDDHFQVQINTLTKENQFLKEQVDKITQDFEILLNKVYQKR